MANERGIVAEFDFSVDAGFTNLYAFELMWCVHGMHSHGQAEEDHWPDCTPFAKKDRPKRCGLIWIKWPGVWVALHRPPLQ